MISRRITRYIALLLCFCSSISAQSQSSLTVEEVWQYGRGVIYDFDWHEGSLIFSAGNRTWQVDPGSGQEQEPEETGAFFPQSISPDGTRILTQGLNEMMFREALIREASTDAIIARIPYAYVESDSFLWQPNTRLLTRRGYDERRPEEQRNFMGFWNADSGELIGTVGGYADGIKIFRWHPDGKLLAVSLTNDTIMIENITHGEQPRQLSLASTAAAVAWSPDGRFLAATSNSVTPVYLWRTDTFEPIPMESQPLFILSLAWNSDSTHLAGSLIGSGVGIWNIETGELTTLGVEAEDGLERYVEQVAWHGNMLAALDATQRLRVWNTDTGALIWDSTAHEFQNRIWNFAVSGDGTQIAIGFISTFTIPILDAKTGIPQQTLRSPRLLYRITDMAWRPSGEQPAVSTGDLFLWSLLPNAPQEPLQIDTVDSVSWSPDGTLAVTTNGYETVRLINGDIGDVLEAREEPFVLFSNLSPDGRHLALYRHNPAGDGDNTPLYQIDLWDRQQDISTTVMFPPRRERLPILTPNPQFIWLPESAGLMGYTKDGALWRWMVGDSEAEIIVPGPDEDMTNQTFFLSLNASGKLLAISNPMTEGRIHILDAESGNFLLALSDHADGTGLFAWGGNEMLFVYDGVLHAYRIH